MHVADALYGVITIPDRLAPILRTPQVQRLREVRLINTTSPSLAALSDVRRFAHTAGVLHLGLRASDHLRDTLSSTEVDTLLVAAILHDVGTPAFAHLFEYVLRAEYGFTHEAMVESVIECSEYPLPDTLQTTSRGQPHLKDLIENLGVGCDDVVSCVLGTSPLGMLVSGTMDFDNIDNVYRMAFNLGLKIDIDNALALASAMNVDSSTHRLTLHSDSAMFQIEEWLHLRRKTYEVLAFDEQAVAGQAMLTECVSNAVSAGHVSVSDWILTDDQLLTKLAAIGGHSGFSFAETVHRFRVADYFSLIYMGWYGSVMEVDLRNLASRAEFKARLEEVLRVPVFPYIFCDNGTFEKRINARVGESSTDERNFEAGTNSNSIIVSLFVEHPMECTSRVQDRIHETLAEFGLYYECLNLLPSKQESYSHSKSANRSAPRH